MAHTEAGPKNLEDLPIDIAGELFEHLSSPSDLLHIAQASKSLFRLAIRHLYRDLTYETPAHFFHNKPFWQRTDLGLENIAETPRSVVIGKKLGQGFIPDAHDRGLHIPQTQTGFAKVSYVPQATETFPPAFLELFERLISFSNLRSVSFRHARLPSELYSALGQLPKSLRLLSFEQCTFVSTSVPMHTPDMVAELPITELNLTGSVLQGRSSLVHAGGMHNILSSSVYTPFFRQNRSYLDMFQILTRSPHVRALCLDWNHTNASRFSRDPDLPTPAFSQLKYLEFRSWNQSDVAWNSESNSPETKVLLKSAMLKLLTPCNQLTELVLFGYMPGVAPTVVPLLPALKSYTGPVDFLRSTLRGCDRLEKIILPGSIKDVDALMSNTLPYNASRAVRYFDVTLEKWDIEIMYAIIAEIPAVEELRVQYEKDYPDEDMLVSFGPEFLSHLPNIRVFQIYRPHDDRDLEMNLYDQLVSTSRFASPPIYLRNGVNSTSRISRLNVAQSSHHHPGLPPPIPAHNKTASTIAGPSNLIKLNRPCACTTLHPIPLPPQQRQRIVPVTDVGPSGLPNAHEYMASWQKYASGLREVRLVDTFVWRRAGVEDDWCRRDLKVSVDEEEEDGAKAMNDGDLAAGRCPFDGGSMRPIDRAGLGRGAWYGGSGPNASHGGPRTFQFHAPSIVIDDDDDGGDDFFGAFDYE
ncbi:hypothetical protein D9757_001596 [Collybiopsis confluens]|uniref:F-box domain-containing protein n=1 Tax=Collybiopsis confluens TaxID=2823264 RepID=A0A8H5MFN0_9AGAR|nr:hypothetical protein D9757_001596 [Collybiopsis confluens]